MAVGILVEARTFFDVATYNAIMYGRPELTYWVDFAWRVLEELRLMFKACALFWNIIWTLSQFGVKTKMYEDIITHEWMCVLIVRTSKGVVGLRFGVRRDTWFGWLMCL
jgi:hypothetical protein